MRWTRVVATSAFAVSLSAALAMVSCSKQTGTTTTTMTAEQKVALGKRLTWAGGCQDCHTPGGMYGSPDTTRLLSGSELGWHGPWGVSYPRNLTPDTQTGIGSWTEEQIVTAFTQGHRPDGSPLLPPMPWPGYAAGLTPEEAQAIAAYLKTIPPVVHQVPAVIPPGQPVTGAVLAMPPPPAWDAQNLPPPGSVSPGVAAPPAGGAPAAGDTAAGTP